MKTAQAPIRFSRLPKTYEGLCHLHLPRPIHDWVALENATEMIDALAGHELNGEQEDYLDLLSDLVADFEETADSVKLSSRTPVDRLRAVLTSGEMSGSDLSRLLGVDRTLGTKILRGERQLTLDHVRKLAAHFGLKADYFV